MTYWKTPHFKAMQAAWYAKLAGEGFEDAEELVGHEMRLKQSSGSPLKHDDMLSASSKETYFRILSGNIKENVFDSKVDRIILLLRADGAKIQQIVDTLILLGKKRCRMTVRMTIRKYEMQWGIREYTAKQLNKYIPKKAHLIR